MIHIVGAGCGALDLITLRGKRYLEEADVIIYAGSLVNPALLGFAKKDCTVFDSAKMTLEEVLGVIEKAEAQRARDEEKRRAQAEREAARAKEKSQKAKDRLLGNILGSAGSTIGRKITDKIFKDIFK